jgi:hypothetical protein
MERLYPSEQNFELHNFMDNKQRIHIATLNFENKPYQWYQWVVKRKPPFYHYTWVLLTRDLEPQYGKVWEHDYFSQLTRIKHLGDIEDYNSEFQVLAARVDDISDEHLLEAYMGRLKEDIKHEIFLKHPIKIMDAMQFARHIQAKNKATHKLTIGAYAGSKDRFGVYKTTVPQPTKLTPQQMDERRAKGLSFNCDNKYSKGHKYSQKKLFYIDCEEEEDQELESSQDRDLKDTTTPMISCHALADIKTPQILKIQGYMKKKKVTMLIDFDNTHNFINYKLAKDLNCFVFLALKFQVMIAERGTVNCSGEVP